VPPSPEKDDASPEKDVAQIESLSTTSAQSDASRTISPSIGFLTASERDILKAAAFQPAAAAAAESQSLDSGEHMLRWIDGASFLGGLKEGKMHGFGKWTSADGDITYVGEWMDDRWHGKGELVCDVGTYDGEFSQGVFEGRGIMHWKDHRYYEGQWKQGKRHGYGLNMGKFGQQRVGFWSENRYLGREEEAQPYIGLEEETGCISLLGTWGAGTGHR
jgi:hypothetical protein